VFLWNLMLALTWAALTGDFHLQNVFIGFLLGYLVLYMVRNVVGSPRYAERMGKAIGFAFYFLWEMLLANLKVAYDVLTPTHHMRPGVIAIPLDARTDFEITILANLITLTPGTMSLDVSTDRRVLYIHAMYVDDPDELRRKIKHGFERRLLELTR
jgi:multicomponent Na+:H+ antiporter subunit E